MGKAVGTFEGNAENNYKQLRIIYRHDSRKNGNQYDGPNG